MAIAGDVRKWAFILRGEVRAAKACAPSPKKTSREQLELESALPVTGRARPDHETTEESHVSVGVRMAAHLQLQELRSTVHNPWILEYRGVAAAATMSLAQPTRAMQWSPSSVSTESPGESSPESSPSLSTTGE